MNRLPFRALTAVTGPPCQLISAQRGARKVARPKRHDELPAGVELHKDRASAVGLLLRRDPVILPEPTPFEAAYAAHCDDLRLEVAKPFATDFYFKKGTSDEQLFRSAQDLLGKSRGAKGEETGAPSESDLEADDASVSGRSATENPYAPYSGPLAPRTTEADASGDVTSLNRALDRTLFLVVKKRGENGKWTLPESSIESTELLHEAAQRLLKEDFGDLDTWLVGRVPVGYFSYGEQGNAGANVFYMKAHVMSGQIKGDQKSKLEHAWLSKDEIREKVDPEYFAAVKDMM